MEQGLLFRPDAFRDRYWNRGRQVAGDVEPSKMDLELRKKIWLQVGKEKQDHVVPQRRRPRGMKRAKQVGRAM